MDSLCLLEDLCKLDGEVGTHVAIIVVAGFLAGVEARRSTCEA